MDAVKACFDDALSDEAMEVLDTLLSAEDTYAYYLRENDDTYRDSFLELIEELKTAYNALSDKSEFAVFKAMYDHYVALADSL